MGSDERRRAGHPECRVPRMIRTEHVFNTFLSAHCGFVILQNCLDVHTIEDIEALEGRYASRSSLRP